MCQVYYKVLEALKDKKYVEKNGKLCVIFVIQHIDVCYMWLYWISM